MGQTSVAKGLHSVTNSYDAACKRLLSERQVLSRILNGCLDEFATTDARTIEQRCLAGNVRIGDDPVERDKTAGRVQCLSEEDATIAEGSARFDIRFDALVPSREDSEQVRVEINVEAQNKYSPGYPLLKRAIYYCGRMISMQGSDVVSKSRYGRLRKVVSIWVCTHPSKSHVGTATSFRIMPKNLVGSTEYPSEDYNLLEVVMLCLNSDVPGSSEGMLGMLEILLTTKISAYKKLSILRDGYGMIVSDNMSEEVDYMCNLSEGVLEEGREQERRKFAEERRRFAEERGRFFETAASLVRDGLLGTHEAAERFGLSEDDLIKAL